jgi:HEAT repeat protein
VALKHSDPKERATAAYRLALLNDPQALEPAIAALDDTEHGGRRTWQTG